MQRATLRWTTLRRTTLRWATSNRGARVTCFLGIVGPLAFVGAWVFGSMVADSYSMTDDAISQLAAVSAPTRWLMSAGFVTYGIAMPAFAIFLRQTFSRSAAWATAISGIATLGVAALPLGFSANMDVAHGVAAFIGYGGIVLAPLFGAKALWRTSHRWAGNVSVLLAAFSCTALIVSIFSSDNGLFQRIGLTLGDIWFIAVARLLKPTQRGPGGLPS
jgi:hypothetical membrane protein